MDKETVNAECAFCGKNAVMDIRGTLTCSEHKNFEDAEATIVDGIPLFDYGIAKKHKWVG